MTTDGAYHGEFTLRVGPFSAVHRGTIRIEAADDAARRITVGQGNLAGHGATIVNTLSELGGATRVESPQRGDWRRRGSRRCRRTRPAARRRDLGDDVDAGRAVDFGERVDDVAPCPADPLIDSRCWRAASSAASIRIVPR